MTRLVPILPLLAVGTVLASCGGGGSPTGSGSDDGGPGGPMMSRQIEANPSFAVIQDILERRGCTGPSCHSSGQGELYLFDSEPETNYDNLVGDTAFAEPEYLLVEPGNVRDSYVIIKLEGRQNEGDPMPPGGPPLDSIDLTNFRNWIESGAPAPR